jgi:hypothetical protein
LFDGHSQKFVAQVAKQCTSLSFEANTMTIRVCQIFLVKEISEWDIQLARQGDEDPKSWEMYTSLYLGYPINGAVKALGQLFLRQPTMYSCLGNVAADFVL